MSLLSFSFLVFISIGVILYYLLPKSWQWLELLILSVLFYVFAATPHTIIYLVISTVTAYLSTNLISRPGFQTGNRRKFVVGCGVFSVIINITLWFVLKCSDIWGKVIPGTDSYSALGLVASLGMGYYTFQIVGYILDCYMGTIVPQKNPLKLFLFVCFFPQLTTGPISRYSQLEGLFDKHELSYKNITYGAQRILWGFVKKLVLAERIGIAVNAIWNMQNADGSYLWIAFILYPLQIYADFSACMDIALGTAECFGIQLPENFNSPLFSRTIQEFWQRWHITLGTWAKDYVFYPFLKSKGMVRFSKFAKKKWGKQVGKFAALTLGMMVLWLVMGIWHGGTKHIVGVSLWHWLMLMLGELCTPGLKKINRFLKIDETSFSWHLFQSIRTYFIYATGFVFFRAIDVRQALSFLHNMMNTLLKGQLHFAVFFDSGLTAMGLSSQDWCIILFSLILVILVDVLRLQSGYARHWVSRQILPFRWCVWLVLFLFVVIYGKYGSEYNAVNFIYQAF